MTDMTAFLLRRFEVITDERARAVESLYQYGGGDAQYIVQRGIELERYDVRLSELGMLLRIAHGMNSNGPWPQPDDRCVMCGRDVGEHTDHLCHTFSCRENYPAKYEASHD